MDEKPQQPDVSPVAAPSPPDVQRVGATGLLLALVSLSLGVALAWGWQQMRLAAQATDDATSLRAIAALSSARQQDLTDLLTAKGSQVIHLQPDESATDLRATIVWNPDRGTGALVCDGLWPLRAGQLYHLWTDWRGQEKPVLVGSFQAANGTTLYRFTAGAGGPPRRFTLTAQSQDGAPVKATVLLAGQTS